jgi:hypothetical protein
MQVECFSHLVDCWLLPPVYPSETHAQCSCSHNTNMLCVCMLVLWLHEHCACVSVGYTGGNSQQSTRWEKHSTCIFNHV